MNKYRRIAFISTSLAFAGGFALFACSSDDTVVTAPGVDGGPDTSTVDGSADGDVPDGKTDSGDGDAGLNNENYPLTVADVMCSTLANCCFGSGSLDGGAPVDGGTYNKAKCIDQYKKFGFESSNPGPGVDISGNGKVTIDQAKATDCLNKVKALTCSVTGAEFQAVRKACYEAYVGKQAVGQACAQPFECQKGNFCNTGDGGADAGTCQPVRGIDGNCGDWTADPEASQYSCSYRYSGDPKRYCEFYDFTNGVALDAVDWKCKAARANGEQCANSTWCADGVCDVDTFVCTSPAQPFPPSVCSNFVQ